MEFCSKFTYGEQVYQILMKEVLRISGLGEQVIPLIFCREILLAKISLELRRGTVLLCNNAVKLDSWKRMKLIGYNFFSAPLIAIGHALL